MHRSMSLGLGADECHDLPSMENWLNAGPDWTEHHGIDITPSEDLFGATETGSGTSSLFEGPAVPARPFLKLNARDALELCNKAASSSNPTRSSSMVDSSGNDDDGVVSVANSLPVEASNGNLQADSPRGPLSPAALQRGKSSNNYKRPCDDLYSPPAFANGVVTAAMANSATVPAFNGAVPGPISLFPAARLTLPNVPSMEEIAQTRPKRRNVRISTDPQSVAARHRRERISDRVRVLQHFVPGGTKMDTASMLDEAIHYVKFLQQQLQTLERLGNSYDARFMSQGGGVMMPPVGSTSTSSTSAERPFDLNCAVYQQLPCTSMMQPQHQHQQQLHQQHQQQAQNTWPGAFCSQGFPDSAQEQFCH